MHKYNKQLHHLVKYYGHLNPTWLSYNYNVGRWLLTAAQIKKLLSENIAISKISNSLFFFTARAKRCNVFKNFSLLTIPLSTGKILMCQIQLWSKL